MQVICLDNEETLPMISLDEDEKTSHFKHLFSGDAMWWCLLVTCTEKRIQVMSCRLFLSFQFINASSFQGTPLWTVVVIALLLGGIFYWATTL